MADRDHPSLVLSDRLEHLRTLMAMLPAEMQEQAVMVDGSMTSKKGEQEREQAIEDMRCGRKKYLFASYTLAKEGLDIPCLERLYLTTPKKDYAVITQSIGRIARTHPGKQDPLCYDFVDDIGYLVKSWKKRCATYRKQGCNII
jgi:superfamily II DNA or RNA helicase